MRFEWDAAKAAANLRKHGVNFDEASTVFADDLSATGRRPVAISITQPTNHAS